MYILRIVYGVVLYGVFLYYWSRFTGDGNIFQVLGNGKFVLSHIFVINIAAIYLILPIVSADVITREKEKRTLLLLLITRLGPSLILCEKFMSLVAFMFSFLIMSFPLIYLSYLLGGVTNADIFRAIYIQLQTVVEVAALGLLFSCYCRNFLKALVATYICAGILYMIFPVFFPLKYYFRRPVVSSWQVIDSTMPIWILSILLLWVAQYFLKRYPLQRDQRSVPRRGDSSSAIIKTTIAKISRPIVWREGTYDNWSLKVKIFFISGIVVGIGMLYSSTQYAYRDKQVIVYLFSLAVAILFLTMKSATLFQNEIKHQTWDVLLTTTMTTTEIFWQKAMVLTRFTVYLSILLSLYALSASSAAYFSDYYKQISLEQRWVYSVVFTCLIFTCIQWGMTWLGLVLRNNSKVAMIATSVVAAWCIIPILFTHFFGGRMITLLSPAAVFMGAVLGHIPNSSRYDPYIVTSLRYALFLFVIITIVCFVAAYKSSKKHIRKEEYAS